MRAPSALRVRSPALQYIAPDGSCRMLRQSRGRPVLADPPDWTQDRAASATQAMGDASESMSLVWIYLDNGISPVHQLSRRLRQLLRFRLDRTLPPARPRLRAAGGHPGWLAFSCLRLSHAASVHQVDLETLTDIVGELESGSVSPEVKTPMDR